MKNGRFAKASRILDVGIPKVTRQAVDYATPLGQYRILGLSDTGFVELPIYR
jgi:hypothetical protein